MDHSRHVFEIFEENIRQEIKEGYLLDPLPDTPETARAIASEFVGAVAPPALKRFAWCVAIRLLLFALTGQGPILWVYLGESLFLLLIMMTWWTRVFYRPGGRLFNHEVRANIAIGGLLPYFTFPYMLFYVPACVVIAIVRAYHDYEKAWPPFLDIYPILFITICGAGLVNAANGAANPPDPPPAPDPTKFMNGSESLQYAGKECRQYLHNLRRKQG